MSEQQHTSHGKSLIPQKRILSEITNSVTEPKDDTFVKPKRRNLLGFELASIPQTNKMMKNSDTAILSNRRQLKPSSIPSAPKSVSKLTPQESLRRMKSVSARLKATSAHEGLLRKGPALVHNDDWSRSIQEKAQRDLENKMLELNNELRVLEEEESECHKDLAESRRQKHKKEKEIVELTIELEAEQGKQAFLEEKVIKTVSEQEQLVNLELEEYRMKMENKLNDVKFELEEQIEEAKSFKDDKLLQEIEQLETQIEQSKQELENGKTQWTTIYNEESEKLEKDINQNIQPKQDELSELRLTLNLKETERDKVASELKSLIEFASKSECEKARISSAIVSIETSMNNYVERRESLLKELLEVEQELNSAKKKSDNKESLVQSALYEYSKANNKLLKHEQQRRILENSIMDYKGKCRVYVKGHNSQNNEIYSNSRSFRFNKVFGSEATTVSIAQEFECLANESAIGSNVTILFCGTPDHIGVNASIINSFKSIFQKASVQPTWSFAYNFRSIGLRNDSLIDLLNSNTELVLEKIENSLSEIQSQKMLIGIDDIIQFSKVLSQIVEDPQDVDIRIHIITVDRSKDGKAIESNLTFIDISDSDDQDALLNSLVSRSSSVSSKFSKFLDFCHRQSKCLFVGQVELESEQSFKLLSTLEVLSSIDLPYKRKF